MDWSDDFKLIVIIGGMGGWGVLFHIQILLNSF